ncbi:MAG: beta-lactamase family protein [Chloroflexota bacterium]|nr:beta-lactamase family protein [Chloroflexota bacterium]
MVRILTVVIALGLLLLPVAPASAQAPPASDFAALDRWVEDQMDASRIPGVSIAIVEGDQIVHSRGFGTAGDGRDVSPQTPFAAGSLIKSFTAVAIMQLVEAGKIDLDAPVTTYIPWFRVGNGEESGAITVRHLLNQTSGLSRATGIEPLYEQQATTLEEVVRDLSGESLNRPVGERYEYSNANFATAALVVETVAGVPFGQYLNEKILAPLGMTGSSALGDATRAGMTSMHQYWFGLTREIDDPYRPDHFPGEYLITTAEDMGRYLSMYLAGDTAVLGPASVAQLLAPATNTTTRQLLSTEFTFQYGMGWFAGEFGAAQDARWHLGELPYFNSWAVMLPERNLGVVVMINAGSQMEFFGANQVFSRIPIGVVNILVGAETPGGISLASFYYGFDLVTGLILAVLVWRLVTLLRIRRPVRHGDGGFPTRTAAPLVWEIGFGLLILLGLPVLIGMPLRGAFLAFPDLALVLVAIAAIWLGTAFVRLARLAGGDG